MIKKLEEYKAQAVGDGLYNTNDLRYEEIIAKINEIIEHLNQ